MGKVPFRAGRIGVGRDGVVPIGRPKKDLTDCWSKTFGSVPSDIVKLLNMIILGHMLVWKAEASVRGMQQLKKFAVVVWVRKTTAFKVVRER
jgi:hypothetical protein